MTQEDLEKVCQIIFDNTPANKTKEAVRLIIELVKAVEKPAEIRVVHDGYYPTGWPTWVNDPNKITYTGPEPFRFAPTCTSDISKNTHWEQPCSTTTAMNASSFSEKAEKNKSLGEIFAAMDKAEKETTNKRGFA